MKAELEYFDVSSLPWEPIPGLAGIEQKILAARMYSCRPPGMVHGPFASTEGCLVFEVRYTDPHRR